MAENEVTKLRMKLGMNQTELADALGLAGPNVVSRWETGRRKRPEPTRRLLCLLNDLPKTEAMALIRKLGKYK